MEITEAQYQRIKDCFPRQRSNISLSDLQVINAILYVAEQGCKWRDLPSRLANWHTIYTRMNRWSKAGVLNRIIARLQQEQIIQLGAVMG
jgi:transposase